MFTGIPVAFLSAAFSLDAFWGCGRFLRNPTWGTRVVRVAHEFQAEINMNSSLEQGENGAQ